MTVAIARIGRITRRKWWTQSFYKNFRLSVTPTLMAAATVCVWFLLRHNGLYIHKEDETILTNAVIPILGIALTIMGNKVLGKAWKERELIDESIRRGDKEVFLMYRDVRIAPTIHLLLLTLAIVVIGLLMILEFDYAWSGVIAVGSVTFVYTLFLKVILALDNPFEGVWMIDNVPADWLEKKRARNSPHHDTIRRTHGE